MTPDRALNPFEPSGERREFAQLVGRIQTLTLELQRARRRRLDAPAVHEGTPARLAPLVTRVAVWDQGGIYLSQVGSRHGLSAGGRAGERIGSVGRGRPGRGLTIRLR